MFIHTNKPLITSFNLKKDFFCRISDESALIRNFLRDVRVKGLLNLFLSESILTVLECNENFLSPLITRFHKKSPEAKIFSSDHTLVLSYQFRQKGEQPRMAAT